MRKIYLKEDGRVSNEPTNISLLVTQNQFEKILSNSMAEDFCVTPILNYKKYTDGSLLLDEDIPDNVEFNFKNVEVVPSEYEINKKFLIFKRDNKSIIQKEFESELANGMYYCNNDIIKYTPSDRFNLYTMISCNMGMHLNGKYYNSSELKLLYEHLENEILKINFYYNILLSLVDELSVDDMKNKNYIYWGTYNERIDKEMAKYEPPFK